MLYSFFVTSVLACGPKEDHDDARKHCVNSLVLLLDANDGNFM